MRKFLQESKILLGFFVLLTAATVMSYVETGSPEKTTSRSPEEILKATQSDQPLLLLGAERPRTPASVESQKTEILNANVLCDTGEQARFKKVPQSLVMLNLNVCETLKSNRHIWVKNVTNGFKAQVFKIELKVFRTDFIQLSPGNNKLLIEAVLKDGQKTVQSLEIISGT